MFVNGIERAAEFTRPIHGIVRFYGSTAVVPWAATLILVNPEGWALTCKHVASHLANSDQVVTKFQKFKAERAQIPSGKKQRHAIQDLERRYGYKNGVAVEAYNKFVNCIEGSLNVDLRIDPNHDMALLKFNNHTRLLCTTFPTFAREGDQLKQGKFLCRLGFPFPEFTNFEYDPATDQIRWTDAGRLATPRFPIDGMVTRHLLGPSGSVTGFELSTPGLRGQSGGPAFDVDGRVWGMQSATNHLDLDFDVDIDVQRGGQKRRVKESAFLHVGYCVHVNILKQFMRDNVVAFQEE